MAAKQIGDVLAGMSFDDHVSAADAAERERLANQRLQAIELAETNRKAAAQSAARNRDPDYPEYIFAKNSKRKKEKQNRHSSAVNKYPKFLNNEQEEE